MKVITGLLALGFFIVLLLLIRYIRSEEGFADKPVAVYDANAFFAPYQLEAICPVWTTVYTNLQGAYKTDASGHPQPEDVAKKATDAALVKDLPLGPFPCPFSFPKSTEPSLVLAWLKDHNLNLLLQAHQTLVFCKTQLESTLSTARASLSNIPAKEGFASQFTELLTECSGEELLTKDILPLQCVDPRVELGTESTQIKAQDQAATADATKAKIAITQILYKMWTTYTAAVPETQRIDFAATIAHCNDIAKQLADIKAKLESGQTSF
jgi:hypothetical protein